MALVFEWDPKKARRNLAMHGVSFDEASTAFQDPPSKTIDGPLHSEDEVRFVLLGHSLARQTGVIGFDTVAFVVAGSYARGYWEGEEFS